MIFRNRYGNYNRRGGGAGGVGGTAGGSQERTYNNHQDNRPPPAPVHGESTLDNFQIENVNNKKQF